MVAMVESGAFSPIYIEYLMIFIFLVFKSKVHAFLQWQQSSLNLCWEEFCQFFFKSRFRMIVKLQIMQIMDFYDLFKVPQRY